MQLGLWIDSVLKSNPKLKQSKVFQTNQMQSLCPAADENTFPHLPKRSQTPTFGLPPTMNRASTKKSRGYKQFGQFFHNLARVEFNILLDPLPKSCFNCWDRTHRLFQCWKPITDNFCCNCGRRFVLVNECPRCAQQFWELDDSFRDWLISYIPINNQKDQSNSGGKIWNKFPPVNRFRKDELSDNLKVIKQDFQFMEKQLTKCENTSTVPLKTIRDKNEDADWWDCGKTKTGTVQEKLDHMVTEEKKTTLDYREKPVADDKIINNHERSLVTEEKKTNLEYREKPVADSKIINNHERSLAADMEEDKIDENQLDSLGESSITTQSDENEEDYDNIIVDEDEQMEESCVLGNTVRDFLVLLKAAKYLPLQQQHNIVLRFVSDCKKKQ